MKGGASQSNYEPQSISPPLSLGINGTIDDGAKHKRMNELRFEASHYEGKRTAVAAFTQSGAAVVVVVVRCLVLQHTQGRGRSWEQAASGHAVNWRTCSTNTSLSSECAFTVPEVVSLAELTEVS